MQIAGESFEFANTLRGARRVFASYSKFLVAQKEEEKKKSITHRIIESSSG